MRTIIITFRALGKFSARFFVTRGQLTDDEPGSVAPRLVSACGAASCSGLQSTERVLAVDTVSGSD